MDALDFLICNVMGTFQLLLEILLMEFILIVHEILNFEFEFEFEFDCSFRFTCFFFPFCASSFWEIKSFSP